ncbi:MAG: putative toxin-antitoxin system toxin component, PIN family [Nitrospirota bacterium]
MRVVFDTNVIVSALTFDGTPRRLLNLARHGRFQLVLSPFILKEISRVLTKKFGWEAKTVIMTIQKLSSIANVAEPDIRINVIKSDEADNRILECGIAGDAALIVSGDTKHILPIKNYQGIKILSPIGFLSVLES